MNRQIEQAAAAAQASAINNLKDKTQGLSYDSNVAGLTGPSGGFLSGKKKALAWDAQGNLVVEGKMSLGGADLQTTLDGKQPKGDYVLNPDYSQYKRNIVEALKRFQPKGDYLVKPEFNQFQTKVDNDMKGLQPKGDYALKGDLNKYAQATELAKFALKGDLNNLQAKGDYALKGDLTKYAQATELAKFALKGELSNLQAKGDYALKAELANLQAKGDYALKGDLTGYAPVGELAKFQLKGDYALKGDLANLQPKGDYALVSQIPANQDLSKYALVEDLKKYASADELKKYVPVDELKKFASLEELKKYAPVTELKKFASIDELKKYALADDVKKFASLDELKKYALVGDLGKYALADELKKYATLDSVKDLSNLKASMDAISKVNLQELASKINAQDLSKYATKEDLKKYRELGFPMDFVLGAGDNSRGDTGPSRALVKDGGGVLAINYANDFKGGVRIDSQATVKGNMNVGDNVVMEGDNSWILHTPDDGRKTMYVAPRTADKKDWDWGKQTKFNADGSVEFSGPVTVQGKPVGAAAAGAGPVKLSDKWVLQDENGVVVLRNTNAPKDSRYAFFPNEYVDVRNQPAGGMDYNKQVDFVLGKDAAPERGAVGAARALVRDGGSALTINYDNDFTGGVNVNAKGGFRVRGNMDVGGTFTVGGKPIGAAGAPQTVFPKPDGFENPAVQIGANNDAKDTNIYSLSFGKAEGGTYTGMGLVPNDKKSFGDSKGPVLGTHIKAQNEFGIFSDGWDKLFAVQGGTGNVKVKGTLDAGNVTVGGKPISAGGAGFDGAMNDKQLRLRGVGDGNHFVAYTNNNNVDGARVQGHGGGQLGTNQGGDKTALQWDKDNNVFVNMSTNPLKFSANWSGFPDDKKNGSEISNDTGNYKKLMIVGNKSAGAERRVGVWDRLDVHGNLGVDGSATVAGRNILSEIDELKKRPAGSGGAFDGAMNDKQLRLRGVGDGNHFVAYTGAVDGARVQGHAGGQLGTNKGGDKTALTWNADGDVTVARNAFVGDNVIMSGKNSWILHTPDDGRKQLYIAPGTDGGNWDWGKQTQFMADGSVVIPSTGLKVSDANDWMRIVGSDKNGVALYNGLSVRDNGGVNVGDWGRVPQGVTRSHKFKIGDKWTLSGVGDAHGNDDWLRVFGGDEKGYHGGIAMNKLWVGTADATIAGRNVLGEIDALKNRPAGGVGGHQDRLDVKGAGPLQFGQGFDREANAGQISYGMHDGGVNGTLNIVGAGKNGQSRMVNVWESLRTTQALGVGDMPRDWTGANFKRRDGRWTHFDWKDDQRNYIRGNTLHDGVFSLQDNQLRFRDNGDGNHYIGFSGAVDGPRIQGHQGGQLGTNAGGDRTALQWNKDGVNIPGKLCVGPPDNNWCLVPDANKNHINFVRNNDPDTDNKGFFRFTQDGNLFLNRNFGKGRSGWIAEGMKHH
jgi:hypothetical protein